MSVYARDGAVISGVQASWRPGEPPNEDWKNIRQTFWKDGSADTQAEFLLGDFTTLARFLALTQALQVAPPPATQENVGAASSGKTNSERHSDA